MANKPHIIELEKNWESLGYITVAEYQKYSF